MTEVASASAVPIPAPEDMHSVQTDVDVLGGKQVPDIGTKDLVVDTEVDMNADTHAESEEALKGLEALQDRPRAEHAEDKDKTEGVVKAEEPALNQTEASEPGVEEDVAVPAPTDSTHVVEPESIPATAVSAAPAATEQLPTEEATSSEVTTGQIDVPISMNEPMPLHDDDVKEGAEPLITESTPALASAEPETTIQAIPAETGKNGSMVEAESTNVKEVLAGTDTIEAGHPESTKEEASVDAVEPAEEQVVEQPHIAPAQEPEQTKDESVSVDEALNAGEEPVEPKASAPEPSPETEAEVESKPVDEAGSETPKESEGQAQDEEPATVEHSSAIEESIQAEAAVVEPVPKSASVERIEDVTKAQAEAGVVAEAGETAELPKVDEATVKEETPKITEANATEQPVVIEEPVQARVPEAERVPELTAVETTNVETKTQAETEATAEAETSGDLLKVDKTTEAGADESAAEEPVQAEAPSSKPAPESTSIEPTKPEIKLHEVEVDVQREKFEVPSGLTIESSLVQKQEFVEVKQDAPVEESPTAKESDPAEPASQLVPVDLANQTKECEASVEDVQTSAEMDASPKANVPQAAEQEKAEAVVDSSEQVDEIAHAHANDEMVFDTPTDEELKDAKPENTEPKDPEDPAGAAESTNKEEAIVPSASESGVESLTSIPTEADETPSIAPEAKVSSTPVEAEHERTEPTEPTEPEVAKGPETTEETSQLGDVAPVGETVGNVVSEVKEADRVVEPEAVVREEPANAATSVESAAAPEPNVNAREEVSISTETDESRVRADAVVLLAEVPSEDIAVAQPKQDTEVASATLEGNGTADSSQKVEKVVTEPPIDVPAEVNTEVPATGLIEPRDGPSAETQTKDVAIAVEASKPSPDELASVPVTREIQEETAKDADGVKDIVEDTKVAEALSSVVTEVVPETATEEATPADEPVSPEESTMKQPAGTIEETTEPLQETPDVPPAQTEATPVEVAEAPTTIREGKPEVETADDSTAQESSGIAPADATADAQPAEREDAAEGSGTIEPAATPVVERSSTADKLGADVEELEEILEGESIEQVTAESGETGPETQVALEEPSASAESTDSTNVVAVEEPIKGAVPTTEDVAIPGHGGEPASTTRDESAPVLMEEATTTKDLQVLETTEHSETSENADVDARPEGVARTETAVGSEEQDLKTIIGRGGAQEEAVPDVSVETPTPVSEALTISSEDGYDEDIPLEHRITRAAGIPSEEAVKLYTEPTETGLEDEITTPTEARGEINPEGEARELPTTEAQGPEVPTQSVLLGQPGQDEGVAPTGPSVDAEASEKLKSPWTPSYSVTTLGSSPVHPEEPELQPDVGKPIDADTERSISEQGPGDIESVLTGAMASGPGIEETRVSERVPIAPVIDVLASESVTIDSVSSDVGVAVPMEHVAEPVFGEERGVCEEDREVRPSGEVPAIGDTEVLENAGQANLLVGTAVTEVPERPKSPWTPSYSVTKMGPGVPEPEELHLEDDGSAGSKGDAQCSEEVHKAQVSPQDEPIAPQGEAAEITEVVEPPPEIERPNSPYPPAYSVRRQGAGAAEIEDSKPQIDEGSPASPVSEHAAASVVNSDEPEAPLTPRSELGAVTPGFDSLSEVSEASHIPIPPSSPRTEPESASLSEGDTRTPLVAVSDDQGTPISPLQTPLVSANESIEILETPEPLTESGVSDFDADVESTTAKSSCDKEANVESESHADSNGTVSKDATSESKEPATSESSVSVPLPETRTTQQDDSQTVAAEETPVIPELIIPKLNIIAAPQTAQPLVVTNTLSTDSAYTQISESLSPSQETGTTVTTPDIEHAPISKLHGGTEAEPLEEEPASDSTIHPLIGTPSKTKTLGIAHTLAMRSFPSAFAETEIPSTSGQPQQATTSDTLELDDHLAPLVSESRRRLESTASSLAFPGGWISSPPHKERASLEVATGEFSKPIVEGKSISAITTPPVNEPPVEQQESKWRCVIM